MSGSFAETRRVEVEDLEITYREAGSGEPVVFVHGFPLSSLTWRKVVPELSEAYRCIALDLPGAGESLVGPGVPLSLCAHARLVGAFLAWLPLQTT